MDATALVEEVHRKLKAAADPRRRERTGSYAPTALEILGVKTPDLRVVSKDLSRRLRKAPAADVVRLAQALVDAGTFEGRQVGYEALSRHREALGALRARELKALGKGMDNWGSVDAFACLVAGPAWRENQVGDALIRKWSKSKDRWWRRAAVVCTVALNQKARGGTGDVPRTLDICRLVAADEDEMVVKGLSWALRELSKRGAGPVREFLAEHAEVLSARVIREVKTKIKTGVKTPRHRG